MRGFKICQKCGKSENLSGQMNLFKYLKLNIFESF